MLSSSDLPACSACGSREVKAVHELKPREELGEVLVDALVAEDPPEHFRQKATRTFYACAGCGRDVTDAWAALQPEKLTDEEIGDTIEALHKAVVVDKVLDEDEEPHTLGIGATVNNGGES